MRQQLATALLLLLLTAQVSVAAERPESDAGSRFLATTLVGFNSAVESVKSLLDWRPFDGSFHLTAGYMTKPISLEKGNQGDDDLKRASANKAVKSVRNAAGMDSGPYMGLGWSSDSHNQRLHVVVDFGLLYQGDELSNMAGSMGLNGGASPLSVSQGIESNSEWSPVALVGLNYRF